MTHHHGHHHHHNNNHHGHYDPPPAPDPAPDPVPPPAPAPNFADLGVIFNDASRFLEGGLWQNVVEEGNQGFGSIFNYTADLANIKAGLQAEVAAGQFSGQTLANVNTILADITTALEAATASVGNGGAFGSVDAAQIALRNSHLDILNIVNNDPNLAAAAVAADGATGFLAAPEAFAAGVTAATAPKASLADLGLIFNDAANQLLGGITADNKQIITDDVTAVINGLTDLTANNPILFGGLSGVHLAAVINQLELNLVYVGNAEINVDAGRAFNDNILDIIDVINGDPVLANLAHQGGANGFAQFGDFLEPTPAFQNNQAQTDFWAMFIAGSNSLGARAIAAVNAGDQAAIDQLIPELNQFNTDVTNFNAAQGGIFQARFDTELLGGFSTLGAEIDKMIEGLTTGNKALVAAAAEQMHNNAADVGGNSLPVTGGVYNGDGMTVAEVLATAVPSASVQTADASTAAAPAPAAAAAAPTAAMVASPPIAADSASADLNPAPSHASLADLSFYQQHLWG